MKKPNHIRINSFILLLLLCVSIPVAAAERDKPIVTVLDFSVSQVSKQEAGILVDFFSGHLVESGKFRVIDRTQRQNILNELQFSYDGCTDEKCQLEIGKLLAARYIFIGSLGKLGSRYILNMVLVDVETGETLRSFSDKYNDLDSLVDDTARIINIFTGEAKTTDTKQSSSTQPAASSSTASASGTGSSDSDRRTVSKPESSTKPSTGTKPAAVKLKGYFNFGILVGGPTESDIIEDPMFGVYIGGLFPIFEIFYLGATLGILAEGFDSGDRGAVFFGGNAILGDPGDIAFGLGIETGNNIDVYAPIVILSGTVYVDVFSFKIAYGESDYESYNGPFALIGIGMQL